MPENNKYLEGYTQGYEEGYEEGYNAGCIKGHDEGFKEGREEGRKEGYREALVSIVIKKLQKGMSAEEIADFLEEDVLTIQRIYDIAKTYAPEYDIEKIVQKLENTSGMKQK